VLILPEKLGIIVEGNAIVVDKNQQTNLEGLFAAGDCTGGFQADSNSRGAGSFGRQEND